MGTMSRRSVFRRPLVVLAPLCAVVTLGCEGGRKGLGSDAGTGGGVEVVWVRGAAVPSGAVAPPDRRPRVRDPPMRGWWSPRSGSCG